MGVVGQAMAVFGALSLLGLLGPLALVVGTWSRPFVDPDLLVCGQESLQLTLPPGWEGNASYVLTAWGK